MGGSTLHFFKEWEADGLTLTDIQKYNPAFSFAMPANDVVMTAVYSETAPVVITLLTGADEGTITDANWTSSANWTYIFEYSTKLTAELEFPEVTSLEDDFAFDAWKVVASDVEAIEVGAILASLPVDFAGNLTLRVCYVYNKENPNPWYPVLKLAIDDDEQEREVKFYQDGEEVLSLPIVGNKVYPVDYVDAGFAGLSNGDYGVVVENEDEFDITVEYGEPAEPTLQILDDNGNVFALEADISNASYFTVTVLREGGRVYRPEVKYSFAELEDGITEAGLVAIARSSWSKSTAWYVPSHRQTAAIPKAWAPKRFSIWKC